MNDDFEQRLVELEARLAFQDDTIQTLNDMVSRQQLELDKVNRAMELLARRQADIAASIPVEGDEAPPPHY